jgi:DNA-directed RNA polymerase specialized sigma24 family protein
LGLRLAFISGAILPMTSSRFSPIDWGSLLVRLTPVAKKLFKQAGCDPDQDFPGTAVSVGVLVNGAAIEFFQWCEKGRWKRKAADEDPFPPAFAILRNNFLDLVRSAGHKRANLVVPTVNADGVSLVDDLPAADERLTKLLTKPTAGFADVEARILAEAFYPYAEGQQELIDVIDAVVYCQCRKRREIAELLDITVQEVTDRWEKLRYNYTRHH